MNANDTAVLAAFLSLGVSDALSFTTAEVARAAFGPDTSSKSAEYQTARRSLSALADEGLVEPHKLGRSTAYCLTDAGREALGVTDPRAESAPASGFDPSAKLSEHRAAVKAIPGARTYRRNLRAGGYYVHIKGDENPDLRSSGGPHVNLCQAHGTTYAYESQRFARHYLPTGNWCPKCAELGPDPEPTNEVPPQKRTAETAREAKRALAHAPLAVPGDYKARDAYCVPTSLAILTGRTAQECEAAIRAVRGQEEAAPVVGVTVYHQIQAARALGCAITPYEPAKALLLVDSGRRYSRRTLRTLLRDHGDVFESRPLLFEVSGHVFVVKDGVLYDNNYPEGVPAVTSHCAGCRVTGVYAADCTPA